MSQGGLQTSGFALGYTGSCGCWSFTMPSSDSSNPTTVYQAQSATNSAKPNTWTQLIGVFDATHGELLLYVNGGDGTTAGNGQPAGHAPANWPTAVAKPWSAPAMGVMRFGADGPASQSQDFWNGQLSGACAFYGALASTDVQALWAGGSGDGCAALFKTYP